MGTRLGAWAGCFAITLSATFAQADAVAPGPVPSPTRSTATTLLFKVDGKPAGLLQSSSGGTSDIVITQSVGAIAKPFADWLTSSDLRSGEILSLDPASKFAGARAFTNAQITQFLFPGGDKANSSPRGPLSVTLKPASTTNKVGSPVPVPSAPPSARASDFQFVVDGMNPTITKFDGLSMGRTAGESRTYGNIAFYVPQAALQPFLAWHESAVVNGKAPALFLKNGSVVYLDSSGATQLTVTLSGMKPVSVTPDPANQRGKVTVIVDRMTFSSPR